MTQVAPSEARPFELPGHVVMRSFVLETILLDIETGLYYRLDAARGAMLECLLENGTITDAAWVLSRAGWGERGELVDELTVLCAALEELSLVGERTVPASATRELARPRR